MSNPDLLVYAVHLAFWGSFVLTRMRVRTPAGLPAADASTPVADREQTAPFSRALLTFHMTAFGVMYFGIGNAVLPNRVPTWFAGQALIGSVAIALGAALLCWTLVHFRSWRFRAKLEQGHQLSTGGPFRILRHPIYMALDLLALGTAIWVPTIIVWIAFVLMAVGGDMRARSEEALLGRAFGSAYAEYSRRTKRFLPGLY